MNFWIFKSDFFTPKEELLKLYAGFVYSIFNHTNGREYIGKKTFWFKRRIKSVFKTFESDWRNYTGSCKELNEDIKNGHQITKRILRLCKTKTDCSYYEMAEQIKRNVLFDDSYYNGQILNRFFKGKINA